MGLTGLVGREAGLDAALACEADLNARKLGV